MEINDRRAAMWTSWASSALDDQTLEITLSAPHPLLPGHVLSSSVYYPQRQDVIEKPMARSIGAEAEHLPSATVPLQVTELGPQQQHRPARRTPTTGTPTP